MRTTLIAGAALAVLVLGGTLSACGSQGGDTVAKQLTGASSPASPPVTASPGITVVQLGANFSPSHLRLSVGQQFLLTVSPSVQAKVLDAEGCESGTGGTAAGGLLSVRCAPGGYLYTAEHPGTGIISATVGPRCSPGQMCPQWITEPHLHVTVT